MRQCNTDGLTERVATALALAEEAPERALAQTSRGRGGGPEHAGERRPPVRPVGDGPMMLISR